MIFDVCFNLTFGNCDGAVWNGGVRNTDIFDIHLVVGHGVVQFSFGKGSSHPSFDQVEVHTLFGSLDNGLFILQPRIVTQRVVGFPISNGAFEYLLVENTVLVLKIWNLGITRSPHKVNDLVALHFNPQILELLVQDGPTHLLVVYHVHQLGSCNARSISSGGILHLGPKFIDGNIFSIDFCDRGANLSTSKIIAAEYSRYYECEQRQTNDKNQNCCPFSNIL